LRVVQVAAGLDEPGAGPSLSVRSLAAGLQDGGAEVELHCVRDWRGEPRPGPGPEPIRHRQDFATVPVLKALCLSGDLRRALNQAAAQADILHAHGLWLMPNVYPAWACRRAGKPFVLSPRGMLGEAALAFSAGRKRAFWRLLQASALADAACLHATAETERDEIRAMGLGNPVAVIPNGVDVPPPAPGSARERAVITLGRIHPKKGLSNLVQAWAAIEPRFPDWRLRIVGPDENGHADQLRAQAAEAGLRRVSIEPALYDEAKTAALQVASLFVLPTLNENFALTVAEALAAGTPVIATKGAPWAGLASRGAGWWIDIGPEPLIAALTEAMSAPPERLAAMGAAGRTWMSESFSWTSVAGEMRAVYDWLAGEGQPPASVSFT
jgi:glycosyltransferase involved in cell wall biosynthesis